MTWKIPAWYRRFREKPGPAVSMLFLYIRARWWKLFRIRKLYAYQFRCGYNKELETAYLTIAVFSGKVKKFKDDAPTLSDQFPSPGHHVIFDSRRVPPLLTQTAATRCFRRVWTQVVHQHEPRMVEEMAGFLAVPVENMRRIDA